MKKKFINCLCVMTIGTFLLTANFIFADREDDFKQQAKKITGEAFIQNHAAKILRYLSDEIGPRLTGSQSAYKAADYCKGLFEKFGLTNAHLEYFDAVPWLPGTSSAQALEPIAKTLVVDSMGLSVNTPEEGIVAEVVDVGHGTEGDFKRAATALQGKIALVGARNPAPGETATKELEKVALAAKYEASACMIISRYKGKLTRTRTTSNEGFSGVPAAAVTYEDGTWMRRLLESGKEVKVKLVIQNQILEKLQSPNVIADIKGTQFPDEMVILGAHLDSWDLGPGAADNGLGSAITLETARILNLLDEKPKRTIRFLLFTGEEQGLYGSRAYVESHKEELDNITLMMNLDITGAMYPGMINPYGAWDYQGRFEDLLGILHGFGVDHIEQKYPYDSDDFHFVRNGVPALGLQGRGERGMIYAHTYADTFDKIEIDKLNMTVAAVAIIIHYVANVEKPLGQRLTEEQVLEYFKAWGREDQLKKY